MRCAVLSDMHTEFFFNSAFEVALELRALFEDNGVEMVLMAGDMASAEATAAIADALVPDNARGRVVLGNHEAYGFGSIDDALARVRSDLDTVERLALLENELEMITPEVRLFGATLWTDFRLAGSLNRDHLQLYAEMINDYHAIRHESGRRLLPEDVAERHQRSRWLMDEALAEPFEGRTLVITHHPPLARQTHPEHRGDLLTPAFIAAMEDVIMRHRIDVWVSGHTHFNADFVLGDTRFVSAQGGYPGEMGNDFEPVIFDI